MFLDIKLGEDGIYHNGVSEVACKHAPFPQHNFQIDVRAETFDGSTEVIIHDKEAFDSFRPATVGGKHFHDCYADNILEILRDKGVIGEEDTIFYFKVVA